ncbi:UDP-N-acetylmuramate dehydrogenase [Desulfuromonas soudanensis]|uniref:UDP-N-acetylenolpyruvoylglucosamine reductase n=1 Tax=Desulfuromonas soudanensis TaxID=1603606 RepID=A0A0M4DJQ6_9BACT|nr:UDP-N-acetylmuramate dehydrogenase [Desulfuromonas soudanensis]ALC17650.1 UDP-N-acetylmuramate dehydrogenase [Desulfuromonas soudanensis]
MDSLFEKLNLVLKGRVLIDEPLMRHTTWRVGGPADFFLVPQSRRELSAVLAILGEAGVPWEVIGAGSNLLVRDGGIRGAVIHTGGLRRWSRRGDGRIRAEAGLPLTTLIRESAALGFSGLEMLAGIPGTVGGAVAMNAGAGGQEMAGVVEEMILAGPGAEEPWSAAECAFAYRSCTLPADRIVAEVSLRFTPDDPEALQEEIARRLIHRRAAQGVGGPNAGSVFKNPPGEQAWKLVERAGMRGASQGGVRVSEKHANFIVNDGRGRAGDILTLMEKIRQAVLAKTGIELESEVRILGEE